MSMGDLVRLGFSIHRIKYDYNTSQIEVFALGRIHLILDELYSTVQSDFFYHSKFQFYRVFNIYCVFQDFLIFWRPLLRQQLGCHWWSKNGQVMRVTVRSFLFEVELLYFHREGYTKAIYKGIDR